MAKCAGCGRELPEAETVEYEGGKRLCRDAMGCEYTARPWKNPDLTPEQRNAARIAAGLQPINY